MNFLFLAVVNGAGFWSVAVWMLLLAVAFAVGWRFGKARKGSNEALLPEPALQSVDQVAAVIETAPILMVGIDAKGKVRFVNERARKIIGYTLEEMADSHWLTKLFPGEEFTSAREGIESLMRGKISPSVETLLVAKSGMEKWIEWQCREVVFDGETFTLLYGEDLSDREAAERERLELERKLLEMQRVESLGVMAGGIAHDFNNLLAAILGNVQLAKVKVTRSGLPQPETQKYLAEIEKASLQAADLCRQMLTHTGMRSTEVRPLDLNRVIQEMGRLLKISVSKKAQLSFHLMESLPTIRGDISQIRQVLMNLILNASDAIGDREEGIIRVSTGIVTESQRPRHELGESLADRDYVFIQVADTGCGMDEETQTHVFDPFFTTKASGWGLGLAAAPGIMMSHGGIIELKSSQGEGTTFTLLFPVAEPSAGETPSAD